jgi:hypothetical protein
MTACVEEILAAGNMAVSCSPLGAFDTVGHDALAP